MKVHKNTFVTFFVFIKMDFSTGYAKSFTWLGSMSEIHPSFRVAMH